MPDDLGLVVVIAPGTSVDDARMAHRYWETTRFSGKSVKFAHSLAAVATEFGLRRGHEVLPRVREVAHATSPRVTCQACPSPVEVRSRQQLQDALAQGRGAPTCDACSQERERRRAERAELSAARAPIAMGWLAQNRLDGAPTDLITVLSPTALLAAAAALRTGCGPASLPWIDDAGEIVVELHQHRVGTIAYAPDLFTWASDDPSADQTIRALVPSKAQLPPETLATGPIEAEIRRRRSALAALPETHQAAGTALLEEATALVDHVVKENGLPGLSYNAVSSLPHLLHDHPEAMLGQIVSATEKAVAEAFALYREDLDMRPGHASDHAVQLVARNLASSRLPSAGIPSGYAHGPLATLVFHEILDRDVMAVSADQFPMRHTPGMTDALAVQVYIDPGASPDEQDLALLYWQTAPPRGTQPVGFARTVDELSDQFDLKLPGALSGRVREIAYATTTNLACATCAEPAAFRIRQELRDALAPGRTKAALRCAGCAQGAETSRAERDQQMVQRDLQRSTIASQWFTDARLQDDPSLAGLVPPEVLLTALALIRCQIDTPGDLPWVHDAAEVVRALNEYAVATVANPAGIIAWASDDPGDEQTFERWYPDRARMRFTPDQVQAVETEIVRRRAYMVTTPAVRAAAREVLLDEMLSQTNYHLQVHHLPRLTGEQREALITVLHKHPGVTLAQVINATWRAARDGAATYQAITKMTKEKATSHVVNQIAKHIGLTLKPFGKPSGYDYADTTLLVFRELFDLDVLQASFDDLADDLPLAAAPAEEDEQQAPGHRLTWRLVTLEAGTDPNLHSTARDVVENAAALFAELVTAGLPEAHATLVAFHGSAHLRGHIAADHLKAAHDLLHEALQRDGLLP